MLVRFSPYGMVAETTLILAAILVNFIIFILVANQLVFLENGFNTARLIAATSLIAFLPFTAFALSMLVKK